MVPPTRSLAVLAAAVGSLALSCSWSEVSARRAASSPVRRAALRVVAAPEVGEASVREEVSASVLDALRARGCLAGVEPAGTEDDVQGDLLVTVRLDALAHETDWATSLAQSVDPDALPGTRDLRTARFRMELRLEVATLPGEERLDERRFAVEVRRTPRVMDEDVESAAREEAIEQVGSRTAVQVCKIVAKHPR